MVSVLGFHDSEMVIGKEHRLRVADVCNPWWQNERSASFVLSFLSLHRCSLFLMKPSLVFRD